MGLDIKSVLCTENTDPICEQILSKHGIAVTTKTGLTKEQIKEVIKDFDGLIVRSATKVTSDVIEAGKNLKIIGRAGVGVDNIDCNAATTQGVLVINAPGGNTLSAAELTCVMIAGLSRNLVQASMTLKSGKWDKKSFMANELSGKTIAIIGLGRIGREVAHRMQSFGMKTIGFDPIVPASESAKFGVESMSLEKIWPLADYITFHVPLIADTKNMLNSDTFSKCRKGVRVINCARGGIIDEVALLAALQSGQCGGAGLDVFSEEPPKCTSLLGHPKVICTPHLGASTHEAQSRVAEEIAQQFVALAKGNSAHGIVNSTAFSLSMSHSPWARISRNLGALVSMLFPKTDKDISVVVNVYGQELMRKEPLFSTAVLIGMLKQRLDKDANFVNAPILARDSGFQVTQVNTNPLKFDNISVELVGTSASESHTVLATLNSGEPALCTIDGCQFRTLPALSDNLIVLKGSKTSERTYKALGALVEQGLIDNVAWSTKPPGNGWCAVSAEIKCENMPQEIIKEIQAFNQYLDFWGQLNL